jgi:hypothetical protein
MFEDAEWQPKKVLVVAYASLAKLTICPDPALRVCAAPPDYNH